MLIVRYLIALVFSVFMMATSLRIEERFKRQGDFKISTPARLALRMAPPGDQKQQLATKDRRRLQM